MPRYVDARPEDEQEEASTDEGSASEEEEELEVGPSHGGEGKEEESHDEEEEEKRPNKQASSAKTKKPITISLGKSLVCHVCGKAGHNAGFVGSRYFDCPNKPCYLCKKSGHTTMTCPYRTAPELGCIQAASVSSHGILASVLQREHDARRRELRFPKAGWQVDAAVLKLHSRRVTCLEFHPTRDNLVLSGDKHGQVAVWDHFKVYERTTWRFHKALTNNLSFLPSADGMSCCSASSDGFLKVFDVETGFDRSLLDLNPDGWIPGVTNERNWVMLYGLGVCRERSLIAVGDSHGFVHMVDAREEKSLGRHQIHRKGNKVTSVQFNPVDNNLMVTGSNDWTARLCDVRKLSTGKTDGPEELARLEHPKVVNSAYFSPNTGRKLMTTCIDNRIRIWDYPHALGGAPDRELIHSHDFNRYLTPFRAEWDPKDQDERIIVCGRYISEDVGGVALHPVDIMDAGTGKLLDQLTDPNLTTICPVNLPHPRLDIIVSGSSRCLYAWHPVLPEGEEGEERGPARGKARDPQAPPEGSKHYIFFDADNDASEKKKRAKKLQTTAAVSESPTEEAKPKKGKTVLLVVTDDGQKAKGKGKQGSVTKTAKDEKGKGKKGDPSDKKEEPKKKKK